MSSSNILSVVGLAAAASFACAQQTVVSPISRATAEGNDSNAYPFCAPNIDRYQQVFGAGSLSAIVGKQITHIAFRLDGGVPAYTGAFEYTNLTIKLSTSTHLPDQLAIDMNANVGANVKTVFDGAYTVPNLSATGSPRPFDMVIPLQTPFTYTGGPLLMEIAGPIGPGPASGAQFFLDAEQTTGDSVSRVYNATAETVFADSRGLICRFTAQPVACYPNCDGSTAAPILNVNDFICFQTRYTLGDSYANCDGSTAPPVLNVNDFICFQTLFTLGCP